jgi:hypothetical protein
VSSVPDVSATELETPAPGRPPVEAPSSTRRTAPAPKAVAPAPSPRAAGRTTRVVLRRLDPWTVLKLSIVYYLALFVVLLVAGFLLWAGAEAVGVVGNIESFMVDIGFEDFRFIPSQLFGGLALAGLVLVIAGTVANVLLTSLFNLMSDVVGGLKLTLQEDADQRGSGTSSV